MTISTPEGNRYDTKDVPVEYDPLFCARCGERVGWFDTDITETAYAICEECAAELANGE